MHYRRGSGFSLTGWLGIIATMLAGICVAALFQARGANRDADHINRVHRTIELLKDTLYLTETGEKRSRDYLLTGRPEELEAYENVPGVLQQYLGQLEALILTPDPGRGPNAARKEQRLRLRTLKTLVDDRIKQQRKAHELYKTQGAGHALKLLNGPAAVDLVTKTTLLIIDMENAEIKKLSHESFMVKVGIEKVASSFTLLVVLIIALLILVFFLINAESTARKRFEDHMEALASTDVLTSLQNRRAFDAKLEEEYRRAVRYNTSLSLIMLDVDRFKDYNDTFGHPAGDEVLRTVGRLLKLNTRNTDFPARYGGEEFAVLVPQSHAERVGILAGRLREAIEGEPWHERPVTASIGLATLVPQVHQSSAALVAAADKALYQAKQAGRNRVVEAATPAPKT